MKHAAFFVLFAFLAGCAQKPPEAPSALTLERTRFSHITDWADDRFGETLTAWKRSCAVIAKRAPESRPGDLTWTGHARDWQAVCSKAEKEGSFDTVAARRFWETNFVPYRVVNTEPGLFTGYYEPELNGSWHRTGPFQTPLWQRPDDLITVNLGAFLPELKNRKIAGKIQGQSLTPYDDRAAITQNGLEQRAKALMWVDDPVDAFFLEIQGSGRVRMTDGSLVRVGYAAQNGRPYVPIGRLLAQDGEIERPVTMAKIRAWLKEHPESAQSTMNRNPSAVFFKRTEGEGPLGAQGVALTPGRSLAVDPAFVPLGAVLWLDLEGGAQQDAASLRRLVVAQDTGGAIKGAVRGDVFWGAGPEAEARAGAMQDRGTYIVLLPKTVDPDARE